MGPIHTRAGRDELLEQIEDGVAKGGEVLIGGGTGDHDKGCFLEPAVVAEPGADSRLVREEVFGPVLPVFRYTDFDDAIRARQRHALRARARRSGHTTCARSTAPRRRSTPA